MLKRRPYIALLLLPAAYDLLYPSATGHLVFCVATLLLGLVYAKVPVRWSREEPMFPDMPVARWTLVALMATLMVAYWLHPSSVIAAVIEALFLATFAWRWRQRLTGQRR